MGSGISVGLVSGMIEQKSIYVRDGEVFKSEAERDSFYVANKNLVNKNMYCSCNGNLQKYLLDAEEDYKSTEWINISKAVIESTEGGIPKGGTKGQTIVKRSNTDYDTEWANGGTSQSNVFNVGDKEWYDKDDLLTYDDILYRASEGTSSLPNRMSAKVVEMPFEPNVFKYGTPTTQKLQVFQSFYTNTAGKLTGFNLNSDLDYDMPNCYIVLYNRTIQEEASLIYTVNTVLAFEEVSYVAGQRKYALKTPIDLQANKNYSLGFSFSKATKELKIGIDDTTPCMENAGYVVGTKDVGISVGIDVIDSGSSHVPKIGTSFKNYDMTSYTEVACLTPVYSTVCSSWYKAVGGAKWDDVTDKPTGILTAKSLETEILPKVILNSSTGGIFGKAITGNQASEFNIITINPNSRRIGVGQLDRPLGLASTSLDYDMYSGAITHPLQEGSDIVIPNLTSEYLIAPTPAYTCDLLVTAVSVLLEKSGTVQITVNNVPINGGFKSYNAGSVFIPCNPPIRIPMFRQSQVVIKTEEPNILRGSGTQARAYLYANKITSGKILNTALPTDMMKIDNTSGKIWATSKESVNGLGTNCISYDATNKMLVGSLNSPTAVISKDGIESIQEEARFDIVTTTETEQLGYMKTGVYKYQFTLSEPCMLPSITIKPYNTTKPKITINGKVVNDTNMVYGLVQGTPYRDISLTTSEVYSGQVDVTVECRDSDLYGLYVKDKPEDSIPYLRFNLAKISKSKLATEKMARNVDLNKDDNIIVHFEEVPDFNINYIYKDRVWAEDDTGDVQPTITDVGTQVDIKFSDDTDMSQTQNFKVRLDDVPLKYKETTLNFRLYTYTHQADKFPLKLLDDKDNSLVTIYNTDKDPIPAELVKVTTSKYSSGSVQTVEINFTVKTTLRIGYEFHFDPTTILGGCTVSLSISNAGMKQDAPLFTKYGKFYDGYIPNNIIRDTDLSPIVNKVNLIATDGTGDAFLNNQGTYSMPEAKWNGHIDFDKGDNIFVTGHLSKLTPVAQGDITREAPWKIGEPVLIGKLDVPWLSNPTSELSIRPIPSFVDGYDADGYEYSVRLLRGDKEVGTSPLTLSLHSEAYVNNVGMEINTNDIVEFYCKIVTDSVPKRPNDIYRIEFYGYDRVKKLMINTDNGCISEDMLPSDFGTKFNEIQLYSKPQDGTTKYPSISYDHPAYGNVDVMRFEGGKTIDIRTGNIASSVNVSTQDRRGFTVNYLDDRTEVPIHSVEKPEPMTGKKWTIPLNLDKSMAIVSFVFTALSATPINVSIMTTEGEPVFSKDFNLAGAQRSYAVVSTDLEGLWSISAGSYLLTVAMTSESGTLMGDKFPNCAMLTARPRTDTPMLLNRAKNYTTFKTSLRCFTFGSGEGFKYGVLGFDRKADPDVNPAEVTIPEVDSANRRIDAIGKDAFVDEKIVDNRLVVNIGKNIRYIAEGNFLSAQGKTYTIVSTVDAYAYKYAMENKIPFVSSTSLPRNNSGTTRQLTCRDGVYLWDSPTIDLTRDENINILYNEKVEDAHEELINLQDSEFKVTGTLEGLRLPQWTQYSGMDTIQYEYGVESDGDSITHAFSLPSTVDLLSNEEVELKIRHYFEPDVRPTFENLDNIYLVDTYGNRVDCRLSIDGEGENCAVITIRFIPIARRCRLYIGARNVIAHTYQTITARYKVVTKENMPLLEAGQINPKLVPSVDTKSFVQYKVAETKDFTTCASTSGRYRCYNMTDNLPPKYKSGDCDFWVDVEYTESRFIKYVAYDIRSDKIWQLNKIVDKWQQWTLVAPAPVVNVIDNFASLSDTDALSARCGRVLLEKMGQIVSDASLVNYGSYFGETGGYVKLSSGLIIQFGQVTTTTSTATQEFVFPTPFPNKCYGIHATVSGASSAGSGVDGVYAKVIDKTKGSITHDYKNTSVTGLLHYVFAIGY